METGIKIENYNELLAMLKGITPALQSKVVADGLNEAGKVINTQASINLNATKQGASKTSYSYYATVFQIQNLKARNLDELGGAKIGISKKGWKLRFIQWGTQERSYYVTGKDKKNKGTSHNTGLIKKTNFFYGAVLSKEKEAYTIISEAILTSLEQNINKYK